MEQSFPIKGIIHYAASKMAQPNEQLTLKENQIVMGHVLKLFPEEKALVQIGGSKLVAQLEVPISALERYWFKVVSEQQGLRLQMVKQVDGDKAQQANLAKDYLGVFEQRPSKETMMLSNQLLKENIPITTSQMSVATAILKQVPKSYLPQTVQGIVVALKQDLPLSEVVVRSIASFKTTVPLVEQLSNLHDSLQSIARQPESVKQLALSLAQILHKPNETLIDKLIDLVNRPQFLESLSPNEQEMLTQIRMKTDMGEGFKERLMSLLTTPLGDNKLENSTLNLQKFTESEAAFFRKIANELPLITTKTEAKSLLQTIEKNIGLMDEVKFWKSIDANGDSIKEVLSFKNLLIAASKEGAVQHLKDQIDQLILRLNGQLLVQSENSPTQTIITQIPLFMNNHQTDLTIQWNGKKQPDGTIDPAFCRIFFYLSLPSLQEMMIDVQIQNRVMNITIKNDSECLKDLVHAHNKYLKEALKELDFLVTSISVKPFEDNDGIKKSTKNNPYMSRMLSSYSGVDLKI